MKDLSMLEMLHLTAQTFDGKLSKEARADLQQVIQKYEEFLQEKNKPSAAAK